MNKKYKSAFNAVCPSESSVERIFDMTKSKKIGLKPLLVVAVICSLMVVSLVSANAATDGMILEETEKIVENIKVFINGKEASADDIGYNYSSEVIDGTNVDRHSFALGENEDDGYASFDFAEGEVRIAGGNFDSAMIKEDEDGFRAYLVDGDNAVDFAVNKDGIAPDAPYDEEFVPDYAVIASEPSQE